jgi:hypothetical protein
MINTASGIVAFILIIIRNKILCVDKTQISFNIEVRDIRGN